MGKNSPILKEKSGTLSRLIEFWPQFILAFLFPTLTVLAAFAITGCYPFGKRMMLTVDLYHQYCPFLVAFRDKVLSGQSLLYSWNDGMGQEYLAAYANYSASPLNIFALFFDAKTMPVFIAFITCIRAGLASIFMLFFLSANDNKRIDNITVVFSSSYALCGWFIAFFWNIMWCDAVVLLPLIMFGLRRLLVERKCGLYAVSLATAIVSNYFTGYFICLFLLFFAPAYYVCLFSCKKEKGDPGRLCFTTFMGAAGRFAISSLLAAGASAAITLPTYLILKNCSATGDKLNVDYSLSNDLFDFLGRLMVAANPNIRDGMANVYCGLVIVLLLPLFFLLPSKTGIKLKHKIVFGTLIAIMYLSFTNRTLNFIWHGMHFPNQIPYRESFIMSFLLVFVGFLTIRRIRSLGPKYITGAVLSSAAFLILYEKFGTGNEGYIQIGTTLLFLIIQGAALHTVSNINSRKSEFFCETLITVTMMVEIFAASLITIGLVCYNEGFTNYDTYGKNHKEIAAYVTDVEGSEDHLTFERSELYPNNVCDIGSLYNVKGISIFSSTARESFVKYMRNFGFYNNNINSVRSAGLTRVTATLLNVRNLIEIYSYSSQNVPGVFEQEYKDEYITCWGNPDALSVGFMTDSAVIDYAPDHNNLDPFKKTNEWITSMGAGNVYKPVELIPGTDGNMTTTDEKGSVLVYVSSNNSSNNSQGKDEEYTFDLTIEEAEIGAEVYVYINAKKDGYADVTVGDKEKKISTRAYQIITLGVFDGTPIKLRMRYYVSPGSALFVYGYQLDREGYAQMLDTFSDEQLYVTSYDSSSLSGHIEVNEDGLLFLSVPYAEGWTAEVDGNACEIIPIQEALMGIKLDKGSHDVTIRYTPAGFKYGVLISSVSVFLICCIIVASSIANRKKKAGRKSLKTESAVPGEEPAMQAIEEVPVSEMIRQNDTGDKAESCVDPMEKTVSDDKRDPEGTDD